MNRKCRSADSRAVVSAVRMAKQVSRAGVKYAACTCPRLRLYYGCSRHKHRWPLAAAYLQVEWSSPGAEEIRVNSTHSPNISCSAQFHYDDGVLILYQSRSSFSSEQIHRRARVFFENQVSNLDWKPTERHARGTGGYVLDWRMQCLYVLDGSQSDAPLKQYNRSVVNSGKDCHRGLRCILVYL